MIRRLVAVMFAPFLVLGATTIGDALAAPPDLPAREEVVKLSPVLSKDDETAIEDRIRELAGVVFMQALEPVNPQDEGANKRHLFHHPAGIPRNSRRAHFTNYRSLEALALTQALPYLARRPADQPAGKNEPDFAQVKNLTIGLVNDVVAKILPEYTGGPSTTTRAAIGVDGRLLDPTVLGPDPEDPMYDFKASGEIIARAHQNYEIPIDLCVLEWYFANALLVTKGEGPRLRGDRAPRDTLPLPPKARLGVARLVAIMLSDRYGGFEEVTNAQGQVTRVERPRNELFDPMPQPDALWQYFTFGTHRSLSCLSKSSTVGYGLMAAYNMGLLDYEEDAFKFAFVSGGPLFTRDRFMNRLHDVLWHTVFTLCQPDQGASQPAANPIAKREVEANPYKDLPLGLVGPEAWGGEAFTGGYVKLPFAAAQDNAVDVRRYLTSYETASDGRPLCRVDYLTPQNGAAAPPIAAYRYLPNLGGRYGAYHSASAGYLLRVATSILQQMIRQADRRGITYEGAYRLGPPDASGRRKLITPAAADPKHLSRTYMVDIRLPDPWVALSVHEVVTPASGSTPAVEKVLPINEAVARCLNYTVAALTKPMEGNGPLKRRVIDPRLYEGDPTQALAADAGWRVNMTLAGDVPPYGITFTGMNLYGVSKAALSIGSRDYIGPWSWYSDFCRILIKSQLFGGDLDTRGHGNVEFGIMCLARGYRPIFINTN